MYYISFPNFPQLLDELTKNYSVYLPVKKNNRRFYQEYSSSSSPEDKTKDIVVGEVRTVEPLKSFFFRAREQVAQGFNPALPSQNKPLAIVGAKACDLKAFKIQDYVFQNHDYPDPFYNRMRQENFIIAADCTCTLDTCFCTAAGIKPYPQENFDLNLSLVSHGFVVESGSAKGEMFVTNNPSLFIKPAPQSIAEKHEQREKVIEAVEKNIKDNNIPNQNHLTGIIEKNYAAALWQEEAKTCVECGACNSICPTCHCFLLYDQKNEKETARLRIWDSCMLKNFARVAGGANPRPQLWTRLRNRFEKKFDFFPKVVGTYACTGCGRCVSACPAKIDIRKVLKKLVDNV